MLPGRTTKLHSFRQGALLSLLVAMVAALITMPSPSASQAATPRADTGLLAMAAEHPATPVRVIVQKSEHTSEAEAFTARLGGQALEPLPIINAFAATMPALAALDLARDPSVRWVSYDAPVASTGTPISTSNLQSAYIKAIRADRVWNTSPYRQGEGVGVAVIDSGMSLLPGFNSTSGTSRVKALIGIGIDPREKAYDLYGHGNHVTGIVGGNGTSDGGTYYGVAPNVNLIGIRISDGRGSATASNLVSAMQWVLNNKSTYNIRVVNLSINSSVAESYNTNPICAAAEILWFNGIVVVVSAGNNGNNGGAVALLPPANDPFVITVGATDDKGTASLSDDVVANFSAYNTTPEGFAKPDLVAPGKNIVSMSTTSYLASAYPQNKVGTNYFRMSGTSMSAPMVAGAAALLLQDEPNLTPDQVKYRLMSTANKSWAGYNATKAGAGYLDVYAAVYGTTSASSNTSVAASQLLWSGSQPVTWNSVNWNSVNWNSVNWNSVNWNSVNWNSVNWNSDYWGN